MSHLADTRRRALDEVRDRVLAMRGDDGLEPVLVAVRDGLRACGVPCHGCGVNVIDDSRPGSRAWTLVLAGGQVRRVDGVVGRLNIESFRRQGRPVYRPDLQARDPFGERARLGGTYPVRAVADAPFARGTLAIDSPTPNAFTQPHLALLADMAALLSVGFARLEDLERGRRHLRRAAALAGAIEAVAAGRSEKDVMEAVVREAARLTGATRAALFLFDREAGVLVPRARVGCQDEDCCRLHLPQGESLCDAAFARGAPLMIAQRGEGIDGCATGPGADGNQCAAVPLRSAEGVVGALGVADAPGTFDEADLETLDRLGQQAILGLERYRETRELEERNEQMHAALVLQQRRRVQETTVELLREEVWRMRGAEDLEKVLVALRSGLSAAGLDFDNIGVNLVDPEHPQTVTTHDTTILGGFHPIAAPEAGSPLVAIRRSGEPAYRPDLAASDPFAERDNLRAGYGADVRCVVDVPFSQGTLALNSTRPYAFCDDDILFLAKVAEVLTTAFRRRDDLAAFAARQAELEEQARLLHAYHQIALAALDSLDLDRILDRLGREVLTAGLFHSLTVALVDQDAQAVTVVRNLASLEGAPVQGAPFRGQRGRVRDAGTPADVDGRLHLTDRRTLGASYPLDDGGALAQVARTGQRLVVDGWREAADARPTAPGEGQGQVAVFIPVTADGRVQAVLATVCPPHRRAETLRRVDAMEPLLAQVAVALKHARLYRAHQERAVELDRTNRELSRQLAQRERGQLLERALHGLRERVWRLTGTDEVTGLLSAVRDALDTAGVAHSACSIELVDATVAPPAVICRRIGADGAVGRGGEPFGAERVTAAWRGKRPVRSRVDRDWSPREQALFEAAYGYPVRALVMAPFSHGTLSANSDGPDAFTDEEIAFMARLAEVLSEGFQRLDDLHRLERSEGRYRSVAELATDMSCEVLVRPGGLTNLAWMEGRILEDSGYARAELCTIRGWLRFVHRDDRAAVKVHWRRLLTGSADVAEYRVVARDGRVRWLRASGRPVRDRSGRVERVYGAAIDVTGHKEFERVLRESEGKYRSLFERASDPMLAWTRADTVILEANPAAGRLLGYPCEQLPGMNAARDLIAPELAGRDREWHRAQLDENGSFAMESVWRRRDGVRLPVRVSGALVEVAGRQVVQIVLLDISERVERERLAHEFSRHTVQLQEQERRRVARELHDGVSQTLSAASSRLHLALGGPPWSAGQTHLEKALQYLDEAIVEIRRICRDLRPTVLDDLGLVPALRSLARAFEERTGIAVRVDADADAVTGLGREAEGSLFRIVQEALANVERHAGARCVQLVVRSGVEGLRVSVRDDGRGFAAPVAGGGMGLRNMRERAVLMGARLEIESGPGRGTCIALQLPLAEGHAGAVAAAPVVS